jgi:hypothetical protein
MLKYISVIIALYIPISNESTCLDDIFQPLGINGFLAQIGTLVRVLSAVFDGKPKTQICPSRQVQHITS